MRKKLIVALISLLSASVIMSSGYGKWSKQLVVEGNITVIPDLDLIQELELSLKKKELELKDLKESSKKSTLSKKQNNNGSKVTADITGEKKEKEDINNPVDTEIEKDISNENQQSQIQSIVGLEDNLLTQSEVDGSGN